MRTKKWDHGKAKEEMTECTKSHFTLTKYVTLENMANSTIQNIKCFPNKKSHIFPEENKYDFVIFHCSNEILISFSFSGCAQQQQLAGGENTNYIKFI